MGHFRRHVRELHSRLIGALARAGLFAGALLGCALPASHPPVVVSDGRYVMGTVLEITLVVRDARDGRAQLEEAFRSAAALDRLLSRHLPQSEVTALNRAAGGPALPLSPQTARALRAADRYADWTGGAFDVTVGPLVELWRRAAARDRLPTAPELAAARARVGASGLALAPDGSARLTRFGMSLDLGGLGKGFALDELRAGLEGEVDGALLDFGRSSLLALGRAGDGSPWRLLVGGGPGEPHGTLELHERAVSVSSSLGQYSVIDDQRYGHIIDPRSGQALREGRFAAVLAPSAAEAEAWSTALLVLPPEEARRRLDHRTEVGAAVHGEAGRLLRAGPLGGLSLLEPSAPGVSP